MANATRMEGDFIFAGNISFLGGFSLPANSNLGDSALAPAADIAATKVNHQHRQVYSQANAGATTETRIIHVVYGASGAVIDVRAGSIVKAVGDSTVTIDVKKSTGGGAFATILSAVITLNNANSDRVAVAATLAGAGAPNLVAGDVLEIVITATIGTGTLPTGVFAAVTINEKPA